MATEIKITIIGMKRAKFIKNFIKASFVKEYTKTQYNLSVIVNTTEGLFTLKINELNFLNEKINTDVIFLLYDYDKNESHENVLIYYNNFFKKNPNILMTPFNQKTEISLKNENFFKSENPFLRAIKMITKNTDNNFSFVKYDEIDPDILFHGLNICF